MLFRLPFWLIPGKANLKRRLAERSMPDVGTLPYHTGLLEYLAVQRERGRRVILATGADERIARSVAGQLGLFDTVLASDGSTNLSGEAKRQRLVAEFGERGFDYVGSSRRDLAVWRSARRAILIAASRRLTAAVRKVTAVEQSFGDGSARLGTWLRELRWHHWIKNLLVFVPVFVAHRLSDLPTVARGLLAFLGFCLVASSVYLLDDLFDLPRDRRHPRKRERPLASGRMPAGHALPLFPMLWLGAAGVATALPIGYSVALGTYAVLMLAYVLRLRDLRVIDALVLGCGYTLRIVAGSAALRIEVSAWLLACSVLMFFGLALLKRYSELALVGVVAGANHHTHGYRPADAPMTAAVGRSAGVVAMAVLALYPVFEGGAAPAAWPIWFICILLLLWMHRMWRMAGQGRIHDDPVMFAFKDRFSVVVGVILLAVVVAAA